MKSLKRVRKRHGRCYELAFKVMLDEPGAERLRLVHGAVWNGTLGAPMDHAWILLPDGRIYDPVLNLYYESKLAYAIRHQASVTRVYTHKEAMHQACETGRYGPW